MEEAPILVIDDDAELCDLLVDYLGNEGFRVECAHDGTEGLARATARAWGLVVLDVMLPGASGFDVLRRLREVSRVPVLMLTARGEDVDRIVGLEMGADDYLAKPFNPRELVARIRAVQRRATHATDAPAAGPGVLVVGDVRLDLGARVAFKGVEELGLTSAEIALLEVLMRSAGKVVSREELSDKVLGRRFSPFDRSIDVHVSNLRRKLGAGSVRTVRGEGYQFAVRSG